MSKFVILRKYSPDPLPSVEPKRFEGIITLIEGANVKIKEGAYLTTNEFSSVNEAHKYLAITFSPIFENIFELEDDNTRMVQLINPHLGSSPTRVWPAFGLHGGGCELILIKGKLKCKENKKKFANEPPDAFHQDSTKSEKVFLSRLVEILWKWLEKRKAEIPGKSNPAMKVIDGLGVVISWLGEPSYKNYAISCAYQKELDSVDLRFWGYVWDDDESERKRLLCNPIIRDAHVNVSLEQLKRKIKQNEDIKQEIENILSDIHDDLIPLAQDFDTCSKDTISLPPYISIRYR